MGAPRTFSIAPPRAPTSEAASAISVACALSTIIWCHQSPSTLQTRNNQTASCLRSGYSASFGACRSDLRRASLHRTPCDPIRPCSSRRHDCSNKLPPLCRSEHPVGRGEVENRFGKVDGLPFCVHNAVEFLPACILDDDDSLCLSSRI